MNEKQLGFELIRFGTNSVILKEDAIISVEFNEDNVILKDVVKRIGLSVTDVVMTNKNIFLISGHKLYYKNQK